MTDIPTEPTTPDPDTEVAPPAPSGTPPADPGQPDGDVKPESEGDTDPQSSPQNQELQETDGAA